MKYMGSKNRIAKDILPIILEGRKQNQYFVEPFCGGCNMTDKVDSPIIANDSNEYLIAMWKAVQDGWLPRDDYTEDYYDYVKANRDKVEKHIVGYVGFALSYSGKFFNSWARDGEGRRNYVEESYKNALKQFPIIASKDIKFTCGSYDELEIPNNSIIYCDPPYANTGKYKDDIDHDKFWDWCRKKVSEGHRIFISEYNAPDDFRCVWSKEITSSLTQDTGAKTGVEKLFIPKGQKITLIEKPLF